MNVLRDRTVLFLAELVLSFATTRTRARIRIALLEANGQKPSAVLLEQAKWGRRPAA